MLGLFPHLKNYQLIFTAADWANGIYEDTLEWVEFTGFGSTQPGGKTDPLSVGTLTVNPGSVGTTLTLATGSGGSSALTITGQDGGDILLINSGAVLLNKLLK